MTIKKRLEKIEEALKPEFEVIVIKDDEEHLGASPGGPSKIVITESELKEISAKVERARAEGLINFFPHRSGRKSVNEP